MKIYTQEERTQLLTKVAELRKAGASMDKAIKTAGISYGTYVSWNKKKGTPVKRTYKKRPKPELVTLTTVTPQNRIALILVRPEELTQTLRELNY